MARRPHLGLRRLEGELARRKRRGFPSGPKRIHTEHGNKLVLEAVAIIEGNAAKADAGPDPSIILKVSTSGFVDEVALNGMDLEVLSQNIDHEDNETVIVHSPDPKLSSLLQRVESYAGPIPKNQKNPVNASVFAAIEAIAEVMPEDRIGPAIRDEGYHTLADFLLEEEYLLDVELWDPADDFAMIHIDRLREKVELRGGALLSQYHGGGIFVARVRADGDSVKAVLSMKEVAVVDLPPQADLAPPRVTDWDIGDFEDVQPPHNSATCIGIVDSGITSAHPLLAP